MQNVDSFFCYFGECMFKNILNDNFRLINQLPEKTVSSLFPTSYISKHFSQLLRQVRIFIIQPPRNNTADNNTRIGRLISCFDVLKCCE